jgi:hypothetical protein
LTRLTFSPVTDRFCLASDGNGSHFIRSDFGIYLKASNGTASFVHQDGFSWSGQATEIAGGDRFGGLKR